jgi:hypothetical protein
MSLASGCNVPGVIRFCLSCQSEPTTDAGYFRTLFAKSTAPSLTLVNSSVKTSMYSPNFSFASSLFRAILFLVMEPFAGANSSPNAAPQRHLREHLVILFLCSWFSPSFMNKNYSMAIMPWWQRKHQQKND